mmetsp:Transcript_10549/g.29081  ORF Transcript_10549/g.29081 Transcript_10549/m.29081 type:complete len:108 (-) Transcript_10549:156-479(-)
MIFIMTPTNQPTIGTPRVQVPNMPDQLTGENSTDSPWSVHFWQQRTFHPKTPSDDAALINRARWQWSWQGGENAKMAISLSSHPYNAEACVEQTYECRAEQSQTCSS